MQGLASKRARGVDHRSLISPEERLGLAAVRIAKSGLDMLYELRYPVNCLSSIAVVSDIAAVCQHRSWERRVRTTTPDPLSSPS